MTDLNKAVKDKIIAVLGSTGSVGRQTLDVAERSGVRVAAISASSNVRILEQQIRKFRPRICAVRDEHAAKELKLAVSDISGVEIISGENAAVIAAGIPEADIVFNSTSGFAGLYPTLASIEAGHDVALANKETLVAAGDIVMSEAESHGCRILPVDSEHCAVFQCINSVGRRADEVRSVILTASGGPFRGYKPEQLSRVTKKQALAHPTWRMGPKITVDCATLMNKGLEVIEAARLYSLDADSIRVVVHPESIIHSMVEYTDNAVLAQLAVPDMRMCISYALNYPKRGDAVIDRLDLAKIASLSFFEPDTSTFPLLELAYDALKRGGIVPAVLNAANERAVEHFLSGKLSSFTDIFRHVIAVEQRCPDVDSPSLDDIREADMAARKEIDGLVM